MQILNYSWRLRKKELSQCLELLPDKYKNIDVKIIIFGSKIHQMLYEFFTERISDKRAIGDFNNYHNTIRCFVHRFPNDKQHKVRSLIVLLHELRHKIQTYKFPDKYEDSNKNYIPHGDGYREQWIEVDADRFARRLLNSSKEKISEIIKVEPTWSVMK